MTWKLKCWWNMNCIIKTESPFFRNISIPNIQCIADHLFIVTEMASRIQHHSQSFPSYMSGLPTRFTLKIIKFPWSTLYLPLAEPLLNVPLWKGKSFSQYSYFFSLHLVWLLLFTWFFFPLFHNSNYIFFYSFPFSLRAEHFFNQIIGL